METKTILIIIIVILGLISLYFLFINNMKKTSIKALMQENIVLNNKINNAKAELQKQKSFFETQPKRKLILLKANKDILDGDIAFKRTDNNSKLDKGTVSVTLANGEISKAYISTREGRKHKKIPVIIMVKK